MSHAGYTRRMKNKMTDKQVVVEASNLEKLFPVMTGFFESIFSIERIKDAGRLTKSYFINIFSKDRTNTLSELTKNYFSKLFERREKLYVHAVDDISFKIHKGETFGLVGESGCGKSTTGLLLLQLLDKTSGSIFFKAPNSINLTFKQLWKIRINLEEDSISLTKKQKKILNVKEDTEKIILTKEQLEDIRKTKKQSYYYSKFLKRILPWDLSRFFRLRKTRLVLNQEQINVIRTEHRIDIANLTKTAIKNLRKDIQIVFQNPYESLSPRFSVLDIIAEPLRLLNIIKDEGDIEKKVKEELESVGLIPAADFIDRYPHELSGGQRQRVGVARAFILDPEFIVADEPVSMLDVSIRVGVLKIMRKLTLERGTAFLFITHDLALARVMCDRVAVMYLGRIVEQGPTEKLIQKPFHPYAKALIAGVPKPDPDAKRTEELPIIGEVPSGIKVPKGCRFHPRCPYAIDKCKIIDPKLEEVEKDHVVACIRYKEINNI